MYTPVWRARATFAAVVVPPLLEVVSFARIERALLAAARWRIRNAPSDADAARWVDQMLEGRRAPWGKTCLRRAAVLFYLLRGAGSPVELCIGVRRDDKSVLSAHAWLVLDGEVYLEPDITQSVVPAYTQIARFPAPRVS